MSRVVRHFRRASVSMTVLVGVLAGVTIINGPIAQAAPAPSVVTLTPSSSTVSPGSVVDLTAGIPVLDSSGSHTQSITQQIDPTRVRLTAVSNITYPQGWSLSYSSDGVNFSATTPASAAAWAAVTHVRATGQLTTDGSSNGKQMLSGSGLAPNGTFAPPATIASQGGDGFDIAFDSRGYVWNVWHHITPPTVAGVQCHDKATGASCGANYPFDIGLRGFHTYYHTMEYYDPVYKHLWIAVFRTSPSPGDAGFLCLDVADVANPKYCGGTSTALGANSYISLSAKPTDNRFMGNFAFWEGHVYSWTKTGAVMCVDTQANAGAGASCGTPVTWSATNWEPRGGSSPMMVWGNRLFAFGNDSIGGCLDLTTFTKCSDGSWGASGKVNWGSATQGFLLPDSSGTIIGACTIHFNNAYSNCVRQNGTTFAPPTSLLNMMKGGIALVDATSGLRKVAATVGTRVYWSDYYGNSKVQCWNATTGSSCTGWPVTTAQSYTVQADPDHPTCLWVNGNVGQIQTFTSDGTPGCSWTSPTSSITAASIVPRMACTAADAVSSWSTITLTSPPASDYTSATLTVLNSSGTAISGWQNVALPSTGTPLSISGLAMGDSGTNPTFQVTLTGRSTSTQVGLQVSALGGAPQLCLAPVVVTSCPTPSLGPVDVAGLVGGSTTANATGSSILGASTTTFTPASTSLTVTAPTASQCGSTLTGKASDGDAGAGVAVAGVTVSLVDSSGNPVLDGGGNAVTATTDGSGNYTFGYLTPGTYKVRFPDAGSTTSVNAQTASGGSGSVLTAQTVVSGASTSGSVVLAVGTNGVVNGKYRIPADADPDTSTGKQGTAQTITPKSNDTPSSGSSWPTSGSPVKLCAPGESAPCTRTAATVVPGEGYYTASTAGVVTFTPCSASNTPSSTTYPGLNCTGAFTGVATALTYTITDAAGIAASSTITPTVVPVPVAQNDTSTGAWNTAQAITPLTNDLRGNAYDTSYPLLASTMGICAGSVTSAASCTGTTAVTTADGTYTLNTATGVVTFTPLSTFTGVVTAPIKYAAADSLGQRVIASITPTVTAPPSPTAADETKLVQVGSNVAFTTVTGSGGLGTPGGPALVTSNTTAGTGLCPVGTVLPAGVANCTRSWVAVNDEGRYDLVVATGVVTYTPCTGYLTPYGNCTRAATSGAMTPVDYVVRDALTSGGRTNWDSGRLTPVIPGPPVATDDTSTGSWDSNQLIDVLANDTASLGTSLTASSVRICTTATADASCSGTSLTVLNQGTYTVDTTTGKVTFDPLPGFSGTATPIKYIVTQSDGLKDSGTITPQVTAPAGPTASSESKAVMPGESVSFTTLDRSGGLATPGPPALVTASTCLYIPSTTTCDADGVVTIAGEGTYTLNAATGVVTYAADAGASAGTKTAITYKVVDAFGNTATSTLTPQVPPLPTSLPDSSRGEQDRPQTVSPTGNDTPGLVAVPLDPTSVKICAVTSPQGACSATSATGTHGTFGVNSDGSVTFTPTTGWYGTESIAYTVSDAEGRTTTNTITYTVLPKPAPSAVTDTRSGPYGQALTFTPLTGTASSAQADSAGTAPPQSVGTPSGLTTDSGGQTIVTQDVINISFGAMKLCAIDDPATGTNEAQSPPNCTATSVTTVDGTYALAGTQVTFTPASGFIGTATTPVQYQVANTWDLRSTSVNTKDVVADPGAAGVNQVITCTSGTTPCTAWRVVTTTISTASGAPETASAYLIPTIDAPAAITADDETDSGAWNTAVSEDVTVGDTSGATIQASSVRLCGSNDTSPNCTQSTVTVGDEGTYTVSNGTITFTPLSTFSGPATPMRYSISDSLSRKASALYSVTIAAPNPPTAANEGKNLIAGSSVTFTTIAESGSLVAPGSAGASSVQDGAACLLTPGTATCDDDGTVATADGVYVLNPVTGVVTYTADSDAPAGANAPVTYRVIDSLGLTATAVLTPTVYARPTVQTKTKTDLVNLAQTFDPLAGDTFAAGYDNTATSVRLCDPGVPDVAPDCTAMSLHVTGQGTYSVDGVTGVVTFTPDTGYTGAAQSATYSVTDGLGQKAYATISPVVVAAPDPIAVNDDESAYSGQSVVFTPNTNDSAGTSSAASVTGLTLSVASIKLCDVTPNAQTPPNCSVSTVTTVDGTYTLDPATGEITFVHVAGFVGSATVPVRYQISNSYAVSGQAQARTTSALLTPTINPLLPPTAADDSRTTPLDTPINVDVVASDTAGTYALTVGSVRLCGPTDTAPTCTDLLLATADGTFEVNMATGLITFTPAAGFVGTATVTYSVSDNQGNPDSAVLSVTVVAAGQSSSGAPPAEAQAEPTTTTQTDASDSTCSSSRCAPAALPSVDPDEGSPEPALRPQRGSTVINADQPVILDPWVRASPTPGHRFITSSLRLWDGSSWVRQHTEPGVGTWAVVDGQITFTPAPGFTGEAVIRVRAMDSSRATAVARMKVVVVPVDRPARRQNGDVPADIDAGVALAPTWCPSSEVGGEPIAWITADGVTVPIKRVTYPAGGVLAPPASAKVAGLSARHAGLDAKRGTSVLTWHVRYGPGCDGDLNVLLGKRPGDTFTIRTVDGGSTTYRIDREVTVPKGRYPGAWFDQSGPHRLALFTCNDLRRGKFTKTTAIFAAPVSAKRAA